MIGLGSRRAVLLVVLFTSVTATMQFLLLRAATTSSDWRKPAPSVLSIANDGLVWITPKPDAPRNVGWEDDWMMDWKARHYSRDQGPRCETDGDTPYDDDLLCEIPGYVPARFYAPSGAGVDAQPPIPRVIFVSWFDRRLGRAMFTSLLTLLHHNPDYEFIFFDDEDVERFICEDVGSSAEDFAIPIFSRVQSGAMRADIWRLLIVQKYGGVYLDSDVSALGKLPIEWDDTAVSGRGCWSHLPGGTGGLLEHWAMAFMPRHPFINEAVAVVTNNMEHPEYLMREDTPEHEAEDSWTMRLTGPAMYQWTLHSILEKAGCRKRNNSYCDALVAPEQHCKNMGMFRTFFPEGLRVLDGVNFNNAISHKMLYPANAWEKETTVQFDYGDYDDSMNHMLKHGAARFCRAGAFAVRGERRKRNWEKNVEKNNGASAE